MTGSVPRADRVTFLPSHCHRPLSFFLPLRAQLDEFFFESPDIGDMTKLHIGHDNNGFLQGSAWHLRQVRASLLPHWTAAPNLCGFSLPPYSLLIRMGAPP